MQSILAIDVTTALLAIIPLFFISVPQPQPQGIVDENGETSSVLQDMWAGPRYVLSGRGVMILLIGSALLNLLLTPSFTLIPLLVKDHFDGGPLQLGWLDSAAGIGIIVGGATLSVWGGFKRRIVTTLMGTVGVGVGALLIGLAPASVFLVAVGATFLIGLVLPLANGPMQAIMQAVVDPEMQGRVFTLTEALSTGMAPIGLVVAGPLADTCGIQTWFVLAGSACLAIGLSALLIPSVMRIEEGPREGAVSQSGYAAGASTSD